MAVIIEGGCMAKQVKPPQIEKTTVTSHFAMKWLTSARVEFYLLDRQTRACSRTQQRFVYSQSCWDRSPDRGCFALFVSFFIRLPVTGEFSEQFQAELLG